MRKTIFGIVSVLVLASVMLAACTPPAPQTVVVTSPPEVVTAPPQVVTQVVVETAVPQAGKVQVYWYIGLGTGAQPAQIPEEKKWVEKYNASQDKIQLIPIIVENKFAADNLVAQIAAGNAPDIVGPVGTAGRARFPGAFMDLIPLAEKFKFNLNDLDPAFMEFYREQGAVVGLPFMIFPSAVFFNKDLFDAAGLAYPPQKVGDKYKLDGKDMDWDFTTVAEVAKRLTLDSTGKDATEAGFSAKDIQQWGFDFQWTRDSPRWFSAYFAPHYPVKDGKTDISPEQIEAIKWYYNAQFGAQPFEPNQAALESTLINGNSFNSGKVAMGLTHLWYTCCVTPPSDAKVTVKNWDVGVVPSYKGKTTAKMHADTMAILSAAQHPDEAFQVYTYMIGEGAPDLYKIYGGFPARKSEQAAFFADLDKKFAPNKVTWSVFLDMIPFMDGPNHELGLGPNNTKAEQAWQALGSDLRSNDKLDVDKRIADFIKEHDAILAEKPASN
jgi:multiple sugar transport system substrate-binding protein